MEEQGRFYCSNCLKEIPKEEFEEYDGLCRDCAFEYQDMDDDLDQ